MQKIISLFQRNYDGDRLVRDEVVPGAEWVLAGEGMPTRKLDGTCCLIRDHQIFKRYEVKRGKNPPSDFEPATEVDEHTGKQQGWVPVGDGPEDRWHREAFNAEWPDGTYELIGPKVQGNPEGEESHVLRPHTISALGIEDCERSFEGIKEFLRERDIEGIVWHHPDGRMVKIKKKDFGLPRKRKIRRRSPVPVATFALTGRHGLVLPTKPAMENFTSSHPRSLPSAPHGRRFFESMGK